MINKCADRHGFVKFLYCNSDIFFCTKVSLHKHLVFQTFCSQLNLKLLIYSSCLNWPSTQAYTVQPGSREVELGVSKLGLANRKFVLTVSTEKCVEPSEGSSNSYADNRNRPVRSLVKYIAIDARSLGSIPGPVKSAQCCWRLAPVATFL